MQKSQYKYKQQAVAPATKDYFIFLPMFLTYKCLYTNIHFYK